MGRTLIKIKQIDNAQLSGFVDQFLDQAIAGVNFVNDISGSVTIDGLTDIDVSVVGDTIFIDFTGDYIPREQVGKYRVTESGDFQFWNTDAELFHTVTVRGTNETRHWVIESGVAP